MRGAYWSVFMATYDAVIQTLADQLAQDPLLATLLPISLTAAKVRAAAQLDAALFNALAWPTDNNSYLAYLTEFAQLIPQENTDPNVIAWNNPETGYSQEVYDRLCQFYWLIDQGPTLEGQQYTLQNYVAANGFSFGEWLVAYANDWGSFLDTPASLTPESLQSFKADPPYHVSDSSYYESSWTTFNQFFYRELNFGVRPVANPELNTTFSAPADCTFKEVFPIDSAGNVIDSDGNATRVRLKLTHTIGTVDELLDGDASASSFYGGTFVHYFLSPFDYHRFHTPVSGAVLTSKAVEGLVYLDVQLSGDQFDAPDSAEDGYEFKQARGVLVIDTNAAADPAQRIGKVAVIPVGMCQVSSVHMYDTLVGQTVAKGAEFGYFGFGGSDIIMLFEPNANLELLGYDVQKNPIHFLYGQVAGYWNRQPG